jgi:hypothetical protein
MTQLVKDDPQYKTVWTCEKWSEDAVDFARTRCERMGISHLPGHLTNVIVPRSRWDKVFRRPEKTIIVPALVPINHGICSAALRELVGEPEECTEIVGNLLLNEGIQRFEDLTMIATVTSNQVAGNPWSNGNAFMGVGDSSTAEAATQTELQAATNRFYKAMNATYPSRVNQTVTFQSDFISTEANYVWNEWTISASATTVSGGGFTTGTINLNRKVSALGTKSTGTWTLTAQVTFS